MSQTDEALTATLAKLSHTSFVMGLEAAIKWLEYKGKFEAAVMVRELVPSQEVAALLLEQAGKSTGAAAQLAIAMTKEPAP